MPQDTFLIPVPPRHLSVLRSWDVTPAHLAYRIGPGPRLLRADTPSLPRGGLMYLDHRGYDGLGSPDALLQEVLRECRRQDHAGVILAFDRPLPPLERLAARLDEQLRRSGRTLYVTEIFAHHAPGARVMIPSALSGGSLSQRLSEACRSFGAERTVLALDRVAEDFSLPAPTGSGTPLTREELSRQIDRLRPSIFFSPELCARYFTYMSREGSAHFVLFDDSDTLRRKTDTARQLGIHTFLLPWPLLEPCGAALGVPRMPSRTPNRHP